MATAERLKALLDKQDRQKRYINKLVQGTILPLLENKDLPPEEGELLREAIDELSEKFEEVKVLDKEVIESPHADEKTIDDQVDYSLSVKRVFVKYTLKKKLSDPTPKKEPDKEPEKTEPEKHEKTFKKKLPPIQLPEFSGGSNGEKEFPVFMELFTALVDSDPNIPVVNKVGYLRGCLKKEAYNLIEHIPPIEANYGTYKTLLTQRYKDDRAQVPIYTGKLLEISTWSRCETPEQQRNLCDHVFKYIALLEGLDPQFQPDNPLLVNMVIRLLPKWMINKLMEAPQEKRKHLKYLVEFIEGQLANSREATAHYSGLGAPSGPRRGGGGAMMTNSASYQQRRERPNRNFGNQNYNTNSRTQASQDSRNHRPTSQEGCIYCDKLDHVSHACRINPCPNQRIQILMSQNRCLNCLRPYHKSNQCRFPSVCECGGPKKHSPSICKGRPVFQGNALLSSLLMSEGGCNGAVFLPTLHGKIKNRDTGEVIEARIFADTGASYSHITDRVADQLNLKVMGNKELHVNIFGTNRAKVSQSKIVEVEVESREGPILLQLLTNNFICNPIESHVLNEDSLWHLRNYKLADHEAISKKSLPIDILLGVDQMFKILEPYSEPTGFGPKLIKSKLGWVLAGSMQGKSGNKNGVYTCHSLVAINYPKYQFENPECDCDISACLAKFWELESIGINPQEDVSPVLKHFQDTVTFDENLNRYEVKFAWKGGAKELLPSNYNQSHIRLESLCNKFKNPQQADFARQYTEVIEGWKNEGIIEPVCDDGESVFINDGIAGPKLEKIDKFSLTSLIESSDKNSKVKYYIPHHGVAKKGANKVRVVLDASAKSGKNCLSLNDSLHQGPNLMMQLVEMLMRFRTYNVVLVSDIKKAFLQISVDPCDRDALRILWPENGVINEYRFTRVPFGLVPSAFLLSAVLQLHIATCLSSTPELHQLIAKSWYMDDFAGGASTDEEAIELHDKIESIMSSASMELHEWSTNSPVVRTKLGGQGGVQSLLGLEWDNISDTLTINITKVLKNLTDTKTKRELLKVSAEVFDPLFVLAPFMLTPKLLFQRVCRTKSGWREGLPQDILKEWEVWKSQLPVVENIVLNRQVILHNYDYLEIHGFCDASPQAYAACVYIRSGNHATIDCNLVIAKTRLAPERAITMPRLELMGAVLLARVMKLVLQFHNHLVINKIVYYTDSQNCLHWIQSSTPSSWSPFVANRIQEIQTLSHPSCWQYVRSECNPADVATRPVLGKDLVNNEFWFKGPVFLRESLVELGDRFIPEPTADCLKEKRKRASVKIASSSQPKLWEWDSHPNFTSFSQVRDVVALVLKGLYIMKRELVSYSKLRGLALKALIKQEQGSYFGLEIDFLKNLGKPVSIHTKVPSGIIRSLRLFLDQDGILRVGTRIPKGVVEESRRTPILLPTNSRFTQIYLHFIHKSLCHGGVRDMLAYSRGEFWIPKARQLMRRMVSSCVNCRRVMAKPYQMVQSPELPLSRTERVDAFDHIGVDYAGPIYVKEGKKIEKSYILLTTCMVTRAINLELVMKLNVPEFMMAFRKFVARRGAPSLVKSDNAQTFGRVAKEFNEILSHPKMEKYIGDHRIKWEFYLERAPWWGGFIERCVGTVKRSLVKVLGRASNHLTRDELTTVLYEIEATVNSRPITFLYDRLDEGEPITPSMLLTGKNLKQLPPLWEVRVERKEPQTCRERLKFMEKIKTYFWNRFQKEYLSELMERHSQIKTKDQTRQAKVGDIVLLKSELLPRNYWKMGRILETKPGKDGAIRSVRLKLVTGIEKSKKRLINRNVVHTELNRSPSHLVPLECDLDIKN